MYIGCSAVFASELVKMPVCLALIFKETGTPKATFKVLWEKVVRNWRDTLSMSIPALSYCFQNCLFFVAISNLSATSYQLWSQSKILATAFFFVAYLGGVLCPLQWFALTLLTAGVGLVQFGDVATGTAAASGSAVLGVGAVILSSALSGFANVYLEKRVKKTDVSLWVRNVQLCFAGYQCTPSAGSKCSTTSRGLSLPWSRPTTWCRSHPAPTLVPSRQRRSSKARSISA